jgi:hypothetical protein
MKVAAVALLLVSVVALVSATTYYKETFDGRFAFVVGHMYFMCHHCMHHPLAVPMFLHTLYFLSLSLSLSVSFVLQVNGNPAGSSPLPKVLITARSM